MRSVQLCLAHLVSTSVIWMHWEIFLRASAVDIASVTAFPAFPPSPPPPILFSSTANNNNNSDRKKKKENTVHDKGNFGDFPPVCWPTSNFFYWLLWRLSVLFSTFFFFGCRHERNVKAARAQLQHSHRDTHCSTHTYTHLDSDSYIDWENSEDAILLPFFLALCLNPLELRLLKIVQVCVHLPLFPFVFSWERY